MPKANHSGATAAGMTGIVQHGAPLPDGRTLSELDPERNLDGTLVEGEHPDHPDSDERDPATLHPTGEPQPIDEPAEQDDSGQEESTENDTEKVHGTFEVEKEESSPGNSSAASTQKTAGTRGKSATNRR